MSAKHTPTPWHVASTELGYWTCIEKDDRLIARLASSDFLQAERDAEFIVRCVNTFERDQEIKALLLAACKKAVASLDMDIQAIDQLNAAIARAEAQ